MKHWEIEGKLWAGQSRRAASFAIARHLLPGEALVLSFDIEIGVANIFGLHLGYLNPSVAAEVRIHHEAGELVLAKVIAPAMAQGPKGNRTFAKARVLLWSDTPEPQARAVTSEYAVEPDEYADG